MTLTTHAIVGAALATAVPQYPALAFLVGFGSHYLLDAIPHWSYPVESIKKDEKNSLNTNMTISQSSYKDLIEIGVDGILGLVLSFVILSFLHQHHFWIIFLGAAGGMTPDALQFVYWNWKHEPLKTFQRLHNWAHTSIRIDDKPVLGLLSQVLIICLVVFLVFIH